MTERKLRKMYHLDNRYGQHRWSKLGRDIRALFATGLPLQIHCNARPPNCKFPRGSVRFPQYWLTLGKEKIFEYPAQFMDLTDHEASGMDDKTVGKSYPFEEHGVSEISDLIREYIERPKETLLEPFENDRWGLTEILRAADRRIGKRRLLEMNPENHGAKKIIALRLKEKNTVAKQSSL